MICKDCGEYCQCANMKNPPCNFCESHVECEICNEPTCQTIDKTIRMCVDCQNKNNVTWITQFKIEQKCELCPFVRNATNIGVGIIYDCDFICLLSIDEIIKTMQDVT